jgi:Holliday junction resolvase RusA-like endonuclease
MKAFVVGGRARVTSDNAKTMPWRQQVGWTALNARPTADIWAKRHEPVAVAMTFVFTKPQSVSKKRLQMAVKPDIDKLCRSALDAMTGILFVDDGQVVQITAGKVYGAPERVDIMVEAL